MTNLSQPLGICEKPHISVLLCTYNPRWDILEKVMDSLQRQTLPTSHWELVIVDNNSEPPLQLGQFQRWKLPIAQLVREPIQGVARARFTGIAQVKADVILMLDDDNILDPDYLEVAVDIASTEPAIGAFGGIARPMLEIGQAKKWHEKVFPFIALRDYGPAPITSDQDHWGQWEPIGAGMVVRKSVAEKFAQFIREVPMAVTLDRNGKGLLSGYDSLLSRCSYRLGFANSYQPRLKLSHFIKKSRMRFWYLVRLLYGHGRSVVMLNTVLSKPSEPIGLKEVFNRFRHRTRTDGLGGLVLWAWDLGYYVECRAAKNAAPRS